MSTSDSITLPDSRFLAYETCGDPDGAPLVFHHGTPGSRVLGTLLSEAADEHGVQVIAPTRPGYGASDPDPSGTPDTWTDDCVVLADHLSLESFAVAGVSGGGPFALRVAERLPDRVTVVGLVGSLVPGSDGGFFETLAPTPRLLGLVFRASEWMAWRRGPKVSISPVRDAYDALPNVSLSEIGMDHLGTLLSTREQVIKLAK